MSEDPPDAATSPGAALIDRIVALPPDALALGPSPPGTRFVLTAAAGKVCPAVLVTLNAPTDVTAGSRFEARTAEVFVTRVNGLGANDEVLQFHCDTPILRVHAVLAGASNYVPAGGTAASTGEMAVWRLATGTGAQRVTLHIGPAEDGGATMPVRCDAGGTATPAAG